MSIGIAKLTPDDTPVPAKQRNTKLLREISLFPMFSREFLKPTLIQNIILKTFFFFDIFLIGESSIFYRYVKQKISTILMSNQVHNGKRLNSRLVWFLKAWSKSTLKKYNRAWNIPLRVKVAVFTPITCPYESINGPPEFPVQSHSLKAIKYLEKYETYKFNHRMIMAVKRCRSKIRIQQE